MTKIDAELWGLFVDEATSALHSLDANVKRMQQGYVGEPIRSSLRVAHNLKGASRVAGLPMMEHIAHAFEDALADYHGQKMPVPPSLCALLEEGLGVMAVLLANPNADPGVERFINAVKETRSFRANHPDPPKTPPIESAADPEPEPAPSSAEDPTITGRDPTAMVRLEAARLDELMRFTDGLRVLHSRFSDRHDILDAAAETIETVKRRVEGKEREALTDLSRELNDLVAANQADIEQLGHLIGDWSVSIKRARMLPLSGVLARWHLIVSEAAHRLGREVRFAADVGDIEIDRSILDGLFEPVMHILCNAVDHGIEPTDEREALGKPRVGLISLRARAVGINVLLEIEDDGRGIDIDQIRQKVVERGLIERAALDRMSQEAILDLVFMSGLSTRESISEISGRGVGLDIVRRRLSDLGGKARVDRSVLGGASFQLEICATAVSMRGLLVGTDRVSVVVPTTAIVRTLRIRTADIHDVEGVATVRINDNEIVQLRWLPSILGEPRLDDPERLLIVVLRDGDTRVGLVVQRLMGEIEFLLKRLPKTMPQVRGISGAMILSDGSVGLVLDVPELLQRARLGAGSGAGSTDARPQIRALRRKSRILAVDDSLTSRALVRNILVGSGYDVETATNGEEAWRRLLIDAYDLVISDVQMPILDGLGLTKRIREHERTRALPVILVTSMDSPRDITAGAQAGADAYIVKGQFDQQELLKAITRLI